MSLPIRRATTRFLVHATQIGSLTVGFDDGHERSRESIYLFALRQGFVLLKPTSLSEGVSRSAHPAAFRH